MNCLDLYSESGGWSQAFLDRGHLVHRIDNDDQFCDVPHTTIADILTFPLENWGGKFDVILASPPCQCFSLASIRHHFDAVSYCKNCGEAILRISGETWADHSGGMGCDNPQATNELKLHPASEKAVHALSLLDRTIEIIAALQPKYWWIENPRGGMKHFLPQVPTTVWYCMYGDHAAKPTHLWGRHPDTWRPRPQCHNSAKCHNCHGATCIVEDGVIFNCHVCKGTGTHHESAPRGSATGTQGKKNAAARAIVPYELSLDVCIAVERALAQ